MNKFFLKALFLVITTGVFAQETNPEESKVKIDVSGNPRLPAAVIPAVITNKPKRLVLNIPFNGLFCFDNLCYRLKI